MADTQDSTTDVNDKSPASEGGEPDLKELFSKTSADLEETKSRHEETVEELKSVKTKAESSSAELDRIKRSIMGMDEAEKPVNESGDRLSALKSELDQVAEMALEYERKGKPMPLTFNNTIRAIKAEMKFLERDSENSKEIKELKQQVKDLSNPGLLSDKIAYGNLDTYVMNGLDRIYGINEDSSDVKVAQFEAITNQIIKQIEKYKKDEPQVWDQIRRSQSNQQKLVNYFVQKNIPPKARQILEEDSVRKEPMSAREAIDTWKEAREAAKAEKNPVKKAQLQRWAEEAHQMAFSLVSPFNRNKGAGRKRASSDDLAE